MAPRPLGLLAKIYTHDSGCEPPEPPEATDWRAVFGSLYSSISIVETGSVEQLTMKGSIDAIEAVLDGQGADPATPLRVRERRAVSGRERFIVTAIESPEAFDEYGDEIDRWFATSAFVPMTDA